MENGKILKYNPGSTIVLTFLILLLLTGCLSSRETTITKNKADKVISTARSYTGTHYHYGGLTNRGIDCSGLVYTSFKSVNIDMPRMTREQSKMGKHVPLNNLRPGDLVFFSSKKNDRKISHVGIVTDIRPEKILFIHASSSRGVIEDNLLSNYYQKTFIKARRVF